MGKVNMRVGPVLANRIHGCGILAAIIFTCFLSGCAHEARESVQPALPPGGILLKGAGATFPSPLYKHWFSAYESQHPKAVITYQTVGSGEGVRRFIGRNSKEEDNIDFGASDAAMSDEEMGQVHRGALLLPMTAGSVALAYNLPEVTGDLKLSRRAYTKIFLGEIKSWNHPLIAETNPSLKFSKLSIAIVVRGDRSGTTYAFTKHLDAISEQWRSQYGPASLVDWPCLVMRAKGNEGVAARIGQSVGSIGYVGYEFARSLGLRMAVIENKEGNFVEPTPASCAAALEAARLPDNLRLFVPDPSGPGAYPIVTLSWILLYKSYDAQKADIIRDLFSWCLLEGQEYSPQLNYLPLPRAMTQQALAVLAKISPPK